MEEIKHTRRPVRAGRFFTKEDISDYRKNYEIKNVGCADLRKGEFFSKSILKQLLSVKDCEGLLIYYGLAPEDNNCKIVDKSDEPSKPRLFLVPVKTNNVLDKLRLEEELPFYLRIDGSGKDGENEYGGAGGGQPHPPFGS